MTTLAAIIGLFAAGWLIQRALDGGTVEELEQQQGSNAVLLGVVVLAALIGFALLGVGL